MRLYFTRESTLHDTRVAESLAKPKANYITQADLLNRPYCSIVKAKFHERGKGNPREFAPCKLVVEMSNSARFIGRSGFFSLVYMPRTSSL